MSSTRLPRSGATGQLTYRPPASLNSSFYYSGEKSRIINVASRSHLDSRELFMSDSYLFNPTTKTTLYRTFVPLAFSPRTLTLFPDQPPLRNPSSLSSLSRTSLPFVLRGCESSSTLCIRVLLPQVSTLPSSLHQTFVSWSPLLETFFKQAWNPIPFSVNWLSKKFLLSQEEGAPVLLSTHRTNVDSSIPMPH